MICASLHAVGKRGVPDRTSCGHPIARCGLAAITALAFGSVVLLPHAGDAQDAGSGAEAGTAVYVRTDSDKTTVIAPRLRVAAPVNDATRVELVYTMDVWTSASIDIRASASKPITEQRDEIDAHVSHAFDAVTVTGGYRFSKEPDYESHGGSLGVAYDFADKAATLALDANALFDTVGRAGDPEFQRTARFLSGRASFTQLLDSQSLVQLVYELSQAQGYLSSPYRFVGIETSTIFCKGMFVGPSPFCVPEANPDHRLRHAAALRLRRALGASFSLGAAYRFYIDDWQLMSHTVQADLAFMPAQDTLLALRYRFYTQTAASQYKSYYASTDLTYYTNDKELSPFTSHRIALDLEHTFPLDSSDKKLRVVLSVAPSVYQYSDFVLSQIRALEVTLATVFQP